MKYTSFDMHKMRLQILLIHEMHVRVIRLHTHARTRHIRMAWHEMHVRVMHVHALMHVRTCNALL